MLFMVIETFEKDDMVPVYSHIRDHGRGLPEGLTQAMQRPTQRALGHVTTRLVRTLHRLASTRRRRRC